MQTDIEVSHWGQVSVEEVHEMSHTGAKLVGGFSRFDYQVSQYLIFRWMYLYLIGILSCFSMALYIAEAWSHYIFKYYDYQT